MNNNWFLFFSLTLKIVKIFIGKLEKDDLLKRAYFQ